MNISRRDRFSRNTSRDLPSRRASGRVDVHRTSNQTVLHASASVRSATIATLASGETVKVSACSATWCSAKWHGRDGWIARRNLTLHEKTQSQDKSGRGYRISDGVWVPSPPQSPSGPPASASAQCNDGTYSSQGIGRAHVRITAVYGGGSKIFGPANDRRSRACLTHVRSSRPTECYSSTVASANAKTASVFRGSRA
jgi:hypothetical protein